MQTLGIDLASQDENTASCRIEWVGQNATVFEPRLPRSNAELSEEMQACDVCAIDAPFGWPESFVAAVAGYASTGAWPHRWPDGARLRELRFRLTDEFVGARTRLPLSVSSERIAVCAFRCAALLDRASDGPMDRTGRGIACEAYPAGALRAWGCDSRGYKGREGAQRRSELLSALESRIGGGLSFGGRARELCLETDHGFDAFVCALVARATACGLTWRPPANGVARERIRREGWIQLPVEGSLGRLVTARAARGASLPSLAR